MSAQKTGLNRIFANMLHLMSGKAIAGIISLAYIALAARMLGVAEYGVLNLVHGYAVFIGGLVAFSGFHTIVSYGADALQKRQHQRLYNLIALMTLVELGMAILAIGIAVLLVPWAGNMMGWNAPALQFGPLYCFAILATVRATPHGLLQLASRFDLIGLHQAVMPLIRFIGVMAIWFAGGGLLSFLWVWLISSLAEGISMWIMAFFVMRKMGLDKTAGSSLSQVRGDNSGLLRFMAVTNFDLTLRDLAPRATPLIIGWILGPAATGLYTLVQRATTILYQPAQMLGQAGYSIFAKAIAAGDLNDAEHSVRRSVAITLALSAAIALIFAIFGRQIMTIMGGAQFASGAALLFLVAAGRAILSGTPTLSSAITALGRPGDSARAGLIVNLGMLPLLPPLLWWLGINGAGWHIIAQSTVLALLLGLAFRTTMIKAKDSR